MSTETDMTFEWKHTEQDHLELLEYALLFASNSEFAIASRRKGKVVLFLFVSFPIILFFLIGLQDQTLISFIGVGGVLLFFFWMFVIKEPNQEAIDKGTKKFAQKYLDQQTSIPIGSHQMKAHAGLIEWYWIDGNERNSYPIERIESINESEARLYIIRNNEVAESIPFHAFGDQPTRLAFMKLIRSQMRQENSD